MTDDTLRVLRVARAVYPESVGGGAIHVDSLSKRQAACGHDVIVLTSDRGNRSLPRTEKRDGYTVKRYREFGNLFGNSLTPGFPTALRRHLRGCDVIHVHSHLSLLSNMVAFSSRFHETPMVLTNHGIRSQSAPDLIQDVYLPTIGRFTFNSADSVLCYSEVERERLRELNVKVPISIIHNGVDCARFTPSSGQPHQQLLFVGRLRKSKGPHLLLDLFERLAPDFPELTVKIVGTGPMHDDLERMRSKSRFASRISLMGHVENQALPAVYGESMIFVLPTSREGVPRTILEAMACGTPVVTTDLPQIEPVIADSGRTVPRTIDAFDETIRRLLDEQDRLEAMSESARQHVCENYSWDDTVRETTAIYFDLLDD